jgi:hypothetical protein
MTTATAITKAVLNHRDLHERFNLQRSTDPDCLKNGSQNCLKKLVGDCAPAV